jgi:hypothetical protein
MLNICGYSLIIEPITNFYHMIIEDANLSRCSLWKTYMKDSNDIREINDTIK